MTIVEDHHFLQTATLRLIQSNHKLRDLLHGKPSLGRHHNKSLTTRQSRSDEALDVFLSDVAHFPDGDRLSDGDYTPWTEARVRAFLEDRCGLSIGHPIPGRVVTLHHEAYFFWEELIAKGKLEVPFAVDHIDAHADLGIGDDGYSRLYMEILHKDVSDRINTEAEKALINETNYLPFAVARQWLTSLTYVQHRDRPDDLMYLHFKDCDPRTGFIQLKRCSRKQLYDLLRSPPGAKLNGLSLEPEIPFTLTDTDAFHRLEPEPYTFMVLCQSPKYTPPAADALITVIRQYMDEV